MAKIQVARVSRLREPHPDERGDKQEGQKMNRFPCGKAAAHNQGRAPGASPSCFTQLVPWAPATAAMVSEWPLEEEALLEPESWGSIISGQSNSQPALLLSHLWLSEKLQEQYFPLALEGPVVWAASKTPGPKRVDLQRKSSICYCALGNGFAHSLGWFLMGSILLFQSSPQKADQIRALKNQEGMLTEKDTWEGFWGSQECPFLDRDQVCLFVKIHQAPRLWFEPFLTT